MSKLTLSPGVCAGQHRFPGFSYLSLSLDFITFYNLRIYSMTKKTWMGREKLELKQIQFILCVSRRVENSLLSFAFPLSRLSAHYVPSNLICVRCESEIFARHLVIIPSSWFHQLEEFELFRLFEHESIWNSLIEPSTNKSRRKKKSRSRKRAKKKVDLENGWRASKEWCDDIKEIEMERKKGEQN